MTSFVHYYHCKLRFCIATFLLFTLVLVSCTLRGNDESKLPTVCPIDSTLKLDVSVDSNIAGLQNNDVSSVTIISMKQNSISTLRTLSSIDDRWEMLKSECQGADSLIVMANLSEADQAKISPKMSDSQFNALTLGSFDGVLGATRPFIMKAVITNIDLKLIVGNTLIVKLKPLAARIRFTNAGSAVLFDRVIVRNVAINTLYSAQPQVGDGQIEITRPSESEFDCYLYPSCEFVIEIVHSEVVISKTIVALHANSLISVEIEAPPVVPPVDPQPPVEPPVVPPTDPQPPVEPPFEEPASYKFSIDNVGSTVAKGGEISLPITAGELFAYIDEKLELRLFTAQGWIRAENSSSIAQSRAAIAVEGGVLQLIASFARRTIEQLSPSVKYRFDANTTLNNNRTAKFTIVEKSTQRVFTTLTATQLSPTAPAPPAEVDKGLIRLSKDAQNYTISLPGDVESLSFTSSSQPADCKILLEYRTSDIMLENPLMIKATLPGNNTGKTITHTIIVQGRNRTTHTTAHYTYIIEQTADQTPPRKDGDVRNFLKSDRSNDRSYGIVYMADGFLAEDLQPGKDYDRFADSILSYVFSKEPFATYKDYLNVYVVYVESAKRGLEGKLKTRFFANGAPTADLDMVRAYAVKAPLYTFARLIAINYFDPGLTNGMVYANLNALFTIHNEATALHEFGHTFNLADEYDSGGFTTSTPSTKSAPNLDITNDLTKIKWKHFIGLPGYEDVGAFEGGAYRPDGIWRPERYSMMRNYRKDFPHFNAPSREGIVKRILEYSEVKYSFAEFLRLDKPTKQPPYKN